MENKECEKRASKGVLEYKECEEVKGWKRRSVSKRRSVGRQGVWEENECEEVKECWKRRSLSKRRSVGRQGVWEEKECEEVRDVGREGV